MALHVLVADNHRDFLTVVTRLLESECDIVTSVADGQAVIDETTRLAPDLLVLDITMPIINGIEVARQLRAAGFRGKIIFLTVHADADYVRAAFLAGADGYVVKSRLASDLFIALSEVLAGRHFISPLHVAP